MSSIVQTVPEDESDNDDESDDSTSFDHLPNEMVLQILSNIVELKTLCLCELVSKRFCSIVHQVRTISFTAPSNVDWKTCDGRSTLWSAVKSMNKFRLVKSLSVELLPYSLKGVNNRCCLFKWKIIKFGNKFDSFVFLSPNGIYENKELYVHENGHEEQEEEENMKLTKKKRNIALQCLMDAVRSHNMLLNCIEAIPLLEKVSIADSGKRGKVYVSGGKVAEMRDGLSSPSAKIGQTLRFGCRVSKCYVPLLELPVSGYVMKSVTLFLCERDDLPDDEDYSFMKSDDLDDESDDKEEAAYSEAVKEVFNNHRGRMVGQDVYISLYII